MIRKIKLRQKKSPRSKHHRIRAHYFIDYEENYPALPNVSIRKRYWPFYD